MKDNSLKNAKMLLMALLTAISMTAMAAREHHTGHMGDSILVRTASWNEVNTTKNVQSPYPVKMTVKGNSLRISSSRQQTLPIYTHTGSLYLSMKLNPGINWLNGLPRGRYRINNRIINIR